MENELFEHITRETLETVCKKAIKKYGFEAQIKKLIEEMAELIVVISQFNREDKEITKQEVRYELADVFLMILQMSHIYGNFEQELIFKINITVKKLQEKK